MNPVDFADETYLRDINNIVPCTKEEQMENFRVVREWQQKKDLMEDPGLTPEEKDALEDLKERAKKAADICIEQNLKLVIHIAAKYRNRGVSIDDLISAGNEGLMESVKRFDPELGVKFASFAIKRIKGRILDAILGKKLAIRIPRKIFELVSSARKKIARLLQHKQTEVSKGEMLEILDELKIKNRNIRETILNIMEKKLHTVSLDTPISQGDDRTIQEIIPANDTRMAEEIAEDIEENEINMKHMEELLAILKPKKRIVIKMLTGIHLSEEELNNMQKEQKEVVSRLRGKRNTYSAVARAMKLTRERIRQIREEVLEKWKKLKRRKKGEMELNNH